MYRWNRGPALAAAAALTTIVGTACIFGGDDDDDGILPAATDTPTQEATETPVATETVAGATTTTSSPTPEQVTYTVVAGDTLGAIANRFGTTVAAIAEANDIENPNVIEVGQVLVIPGAAE